MLKSPPELLVAAAAGAAAPSAATAGASYPGGEADVGGAEIANGGDDNNSRWTRKMRRKSGRETDPQAPLSRSMVTTNSKGETNVPPEERGMIGEGGDGEGDHEQRPPPEPSLDRKSGRAKAATPLSESMITKNSNGETNDTRTLEKMGMIDEGDGDEHGNERAEPAMSNSPTGLTRPTQPPMEQFSHQQQRQLQSSLLRKERIQIPAHPLSEEIASFRKSRLKERHRPSLQRTHQEGDDSSSEGSSSRGAESEERPGGKGNPILWPTGTPLPTAPLSPLRVDDSGRSGATTMSPASAADSAVSNILGSAADGDSVDGSTRSDGTDGLVDGAERNGPSPEMCRAAGQLNGTARGAGSARDSGGATEGSERNGPSPDVCRAVGYVHGVAGNRGEGDIMKKLPRPVPATVDDGGASKAPSVGRIASGSAAGAVVGPILVPTMSPQTPSSPRSTAPSSRSATTRSPSSIHGSAYSYSAGEDKGAGADVSGRSGGSWETWQSPLSSAPGTVDASDEKEEVTNDGVDNSARSDGIDDSGRSGRSERRGREDLRKHRSPPPPPYARTHGELTQSKEIKLSNILTAAAALMGTSGTGEDRTSASQSLETESSASDADENDNGGLTSIEEEGSVGEGRSAPPSPNRTLDGKQSAAEKLRLVQARLERDDGSSLRDSIKMLQLSIRDLQEAAGDDGEEWDGENGEGVDDGCDRRGLSKSEGHLSHDSPGTNEKSSRSLGARESKRSRRSRGKDEKKSYKSGRRKSDASSKGAPSHRRSSTSSAPIPAGAKRALVRCRGGEALPRERAVSDVVRRLLSRIDREVGAGNGEEAGEEKGNSLCVAVLPPPVTGGDTVELSEDAGSGIGKTTIAALACANGDVRARYHQGMAWLNMNCRPLDFDFEAYSKFLTDICHQIGIKPQKLRLSPVVRSPDEDEMVAGLRMRDQMEEARAQMGKLLTSLHRRDRKSKNDSRPSVLVVLDDVAKPSDIQWFQFRRRGKKDGEQIIDLLVTSRTNVPGALVVAAPPLETKEAVRLLLMEADLPSNHPLARNRNARGLVKGCLLHPLTIKFAGRWLGLKRTTSGGQKGIDEILGELHDAIKEGIGLGDEDSPVEVLYALLSKAMSPLVKGSATKIVRLCFAAFITVFYDTATAPSDAMEVPLELASAFFLKLLETEKDVLKNDALFQNNGRQASRLVPEILGALGVFNITQHTAKVEGSEKNERTVRIDHGLVRHYASHIILEDEEFRSLRKDFETRWNEVIVLSYFEEKAARTWDDAQPNRSQRYALERMPGHMIRGEMLGDLDALMCNASFIRGRFWALGCSEGTRAHVHDAEAFCNRLIAKDEGENWSSMLVETCEQLEAVLMEEVAKESGGPNGRCSTLEAGRCLHEISLSLSRFQLWQEAVRFCNSCVELVESNLGSSDLVASLLYNSSVIHAEANLYEEAEKIIGDCLDVRVKTCGTESILYVRALCQLGSILSSTSDYAAAESCFSKCLSLQKGIPSHFPLDFGIVLYKLGRNQHQRGGYLDEAMHRYKESLVFERVELGQHHVFLSSLLLHMGDVMLDKGAPDDAIERYAEALDVLRHSETPQSFDLRITAAIAEGKLRSAEGQSEESIELYERAIMLLQQHAPSRKRKVAQLYTLLGEGFEKTSDYLAAAKCFEESISVMKSAFGHSHLDTAETLVNLSGVESALAEEDGAHSEHHARASDCLKEAITIQKSRLGGDCEGVAITLTMYGAHLKSIGSYDESEAAYKDAIRILQALEGDHGDSLSDACRGLADLMDVMSKYRDSSNALETSTRSEAASNTLRNAPEILQMDFDDTSSSSLEGESSDSLSTGSSVSG